MNNKEFSRGNAADCETVRDLLNEFYDEELDETADSLVRTHVDSCPICMSELMQIKETVKAIESLPREATPARALWPPHVESAVPFWRKPMLLAAALAGLVLVPGVAGVAFYLSHNEPVPEPSFAFDVGDIAIEGIVEAVRLAEAIAEGLAEGLEDGLADGLEPGIAPVAPVSPCSARYADSISADCIGYVAPVAPQIRSSLLEALIAALRDPDPDVRQQAAHALGEFEDPRAVEPLVDVLADDRVADVRQLAAWALGEIEDAGAVRGLSDAVLNDDSGDVREQAAWALGEIEDARAVPALAGVLSNDPNADTRQLAAWALGEIEDARAVPALIEVLLNDASGDTRQQAAWALGEIEDARAVPALIEILLNDASGDTRQQAAWALGEIEDPRAIDALAAAMDDEDADVRQMAIWALGEIDGR